VNPRGRRAARRPLKTKDYTSVLRIADSARVDGGVPPFTRTEFCQEKKRGVAAKCAGPAAKCDSVAARLPLGCRSIAPRLPLGCDQVRLCCSQVGIRDGPLRRPGGPMHSQLSATWRLSAPKYSSAMRQHTRRRPSAACGSKPARVQVDRRKRATFMDQNRLLGLCFRSTNRIPLAHLASRRKALVFRVFFDAPDPELSCA